MPRRIPYEERESLLTETIRRFGTSYGLVPYRSFQELRMMAVKKNVFYNIGFWEVQDASLWFSVMAHPRLFLTLGDEDFHSFVEELRNAAPMANITIAPSQLDKKAFKVSADIAFGGSVRKGSKEHDSIPEVMSFVEKTCDGIFSVGEKYLTRDKLLPRLEELWKRVERETDRNKKGKALEDLLEVLIKSSNGLSIYKRNKRTATEEIDFIVENKSTSLASLQSPLILLECKNWTKPIGTTEFGNFVRKVENRSRLLCRAGLLVAISGLTRDAQKERLRLSGKEYAIMVAKKADIEKMIRSGQGFDNFMWERLTEASTV